LDPSGWTPFKDPTASAFDALGEPSDKLSWMDRCAMWRECPTDRAVSVQPFPSILGAEQRRAKAKPIGLCDFVPGAGQLGTIAGKHDRAAKRYIRVDALRIRNADNLAHRLTHRPILCAGGFHAVT
jgi:hypothetical protein